MPQPGQIAKWAMTCREAASPAELPINETRLRLRSAQSEMNPSMSFAGNHFANARGGAGFARFAGVLFALLALVCAADPVMAKDEANVIARFATGELTNADVDAAIARQGNPGNLPLDKLRERVTRSLAAGYAIEEQLAGGGRSPPPTLNRSIAESRRQIMLDYYISNQITQQKPSNSEILKVIESKPRYFGLRATFRFFQFVILTNQPDKTKPALNELQALRSAGRPTIEGVNAFKARMRNQGIPLIGQQFYQSSEVLTDEALSTLERMAAMRDYVSVKQDKGGVRLLVLLDRIADPVDPEEVKAQIAQGLATAKAQEQRQRLIEQIGQAAIAAARNRKVDDTGMVNVTGAVDANVAKQALADAGDGSLLNLFGGGSANTGNIDGRAIRDGAQVQRALVELVALLLPLPMLLLACLRWALIIRDPANLREIGKPRRDWMVRLRIVGPLTVAICIGALAALVHAIPRIVAQVPTVPLLVGAVAAVALGGALAYAWRKQSLATHEDRRRALWPVVPLVVIVVAAAWFA